MLEKLWRDHGITDSNMSVQLLLGRGMIETGADGQIFPASRWEIYDPDADYGSYVSLYSQAELMNRKLHRIDCFY